MSKAIAPRARVRLDRKVLMQAGKVGGLVLGGAVVARAAGAIARRVPAIASFATTPYKAALVDAGAGLLASFIALAIFAKVGKRPAAAVALAPFVFGGVVVGAVAPLVSDRATAALTDLASRIPGLRGSLPASPTPGGGLLGDGVLAGDMVVPGGMYADPSQGLGGELTMTQTPGGAWNYNVTTPPHVPSPGGWRGGNMSNEL